jgi:hypothetical protein
MTESVLIAEQSDENTGYRFSWGLAIAGGIAATAVTLFLLTLGSGFGLLLVAPSAHPGPAEPTFLVGGAIYFFVAQAFGFAVGGHIAGRLLGPLSETNIQEEFRAGVHGLIAWAVTVLATLAITVLAAMSAASSAGTAAALYGAIASKPSSPITSAYLVDVLYRPAQRNGITHLGNDTGQERNRPEADRLVEVALENDEQQSPDDRYRLANLVSMQAGISYNEATNRIDHLLSGIKAKASRTADLTRRAASYTNLWIAASLLFGALVAMLAAIMARLEDDRDAARVG